MTMVPDSPWFRCLSDDDGQARLRLFTFPFAGGGTLAYRPWAAALPGVSVVAAQLPGREVRLDEAPVTSMDSLVRQLVKAMRPWLDRPFALFGHSMGALTAFECARALARQGGPQPGRLILSAYRAPQLRRVGRVMHTLPDAQLVQALKAYDGLPPQVLANEDIMAMLLPTVRADFSILENYRFSPGPALAAPIDALCGDRDRLAMPADLAGWRDHTGGSFSLTSFPGGHFFLRDSEAAVLEQLQRNLSTSGAALPAV
jgi:medium-chain acyl-[acyl-carrier-protein] hydrolase